MSEDDRGAEGFSDRLAEKLSEMTDDQEKVKYLQERLIAEVSSGAGKDRAVSKLQAAIRDHETGGDAAALTLSMREDAIKEREELLAKRETELDKIEALKTAGIPTELKDVIAGDEPSEYLEKAKLLKDIIESEVQHGVTAEIAEKAVIPRVGETSKKRRLDTLTKADGERMSDREWNKLMREAAK